MNDNIVPWRFTVVDSPPSECGADEVSSEQIIAFVDWQCKSSSEKVRLWKENLKSELVISTGEWKALQACLKEKF